MLSYEIQIFLKQNFFIQISYLKNKTFLETKSLKVYIAVEIFLKTTIIRN